MKKENIIFLILSIISVAFVSSIGIAISIPSTTLAIIGILGTILTMGLGFSLKKKWREKGNI